MQLKHLPYCFVVVAGICLAGAVTTSTGTAKSPPPDASKSR